MEVVFEITCTRDDFTERPLGVSGKINEPLFVNVSTGLIF